MHLFFFTISFILATSGAYAPANLQSAQHVLGFMANSAGLVVERRQATECAKVAPGPSFCQRSCGPLFTACVSATNCYLPTLGQTCCANAEYCPAGTYCATLGCCINGSSLAECNAELSSGSTALAPSVPGTLYATKPTTLIATTPLVATTSRVATSSLFASSNSAVPTSSSLSVTSPTLAVATPSVSTSPAGQTSASSHSALLASDIPSNTRTTTATLPRSTSSGSPALNSRSKNSKDFMRLVSGGLGFLFML